MPKDSQNDGAAKAEAAAEEAKGTEIEQLQKKYDDALSEIDHLKARLENRPEVTEPKDPDGLPSLTGKFKPERGETHDRNGYYPRMYNGRRIYLKSGDDIKEKIRQSKRGI